MVKALTAAAWLALMLPGWAMAASLNAATEEKLATVQAVDPVEHFFQLIVSRRNTEALVFAEGLVTIGENQAAEAMIKIMRAAALTGLHRDGEATTMLAEANAIPIEDSSVKEFAVNLGLKMERIEVARWGFDQMLAKHPKEALNLAPSKVYFIIRKQADETLAYRENHLVSLARLGFGEGAVGSDIAFLAIGVLLDRGDVTGAATLLPRVDAPVDVEKMLISRRFEGLWPQIEATSDPHLTRLRVRQVDFAQKAVAYAPNDFQKLADLVNAYRSADRLSDAIALKDRLPTEPSALASISKGWAINNIAFAMYEAGRDKEADDLFALLNDSALPASGWSVSMKINRLDALVNHKAYQEGMLLLQQTAESATTDGSDHAIQLIRRLRFCIYSQLGRRSDAAEILPELLAHANDAAVATVDALLCGGEIDRAEQLLASSVNLGGFTTDMVRALQPNALTNDEPSAWSNAWDDLRRRPAVARFYARYGRDLPTRFLRRSVTVGNQ